MNTSRQQKHNIRYAEVMHTAIEALYAPMKGAAKILAQACDTHPNTTANWLRKRNAPNGEQLVALMAADPEIETTILDLVRARRRQAEVLKMKVRAGNEVLRRSLSAAAVPGFGDDRDWISERRGSGVAYRKKVMAEIALRSVGG